MFVPKDDRLKHHILGILLRKVDSTCSRIDRDIAVTLADIAKELHTTEDKIQQVASLMKLDDVINHIELKEGKAIFAWNNSYPAYHGKKYLIEGRRKSNEKIYDVSKWAVPITLAFITVYTAISSTIERRHSTERINKLQSAVDSLRVQPSLQILPGKYPAVPSDTNSLR